MTIHAFTEHHNDYPAYINLTAQPDGTIKVSVRTRGNGGKDYASIIMTELQAEELADAIYKHNYKGDGEIDRPTAPAATTPAASESIAERNTFRALALAVRSADEVEKFDAIGRLAEYCDAHTAAQVAANKPARQFGTIGHTRIPGMSPFGDLFEGSKPAAASGEAFPEHWREKANHIVSGKMNIAESSNQAIMLLRVMLATPQHQVQAGGDAAAMTEAFAIATAGPQKTWGADEICNACVKAGLGVFECNALMVTLKATPSPVSAAKPTTPELEVQATEAKLYRDLTGDAMALGYGGLADAVEALRGAVLSVLDPLPCAGPYFCAFPSCLSTGGNCVNKSCKALAPVHAVERKESAQTKFVTYATVRDAGDDEIHIECRMPDGQKGAMVIVMKPYDEMAQAICAFLNNQTT